MYGPMCTCSDILDREELRAEPEREGRNQSKVTERVHGMSIEIC